MKIPIKEWLMVCELTLALYHGNLDVSAEFESFLIGLFQNLDPYTPFLDQQSEKQLKWLKEVWEKHHEYQSEWIDLEDF
jgi:hypothetical protein